MVLTSYEKFDFYHYKTIKVDDASVLVVGARGQGVFVEVTILSPGFNSLFRTSIGTHGQNKRQNVKFKKNC
jgi:hypothetical protein